VKKAIDGSLAIMAGGDPAVIEAVRPVLAAMGGKVFATGPLGAGHAMKALNNYVSAAGFAAATELPSPSLPPHSSTAPAPALSTLPPAGLVARFRSIAPDCQIRPSGLSSLPIGSCEAPNDRLPAV
jgi:hypothetical protein